jgi:hypothetical protein
MEAWFEAVGNMYDRGLDIPSKYEYKPAPALNIQSDTESYWCDAFVFLSDEELYEIAEFLFRYCTYLRFKGIDY